MKWIFIVLFVYIVSLFFRMQRLPTCWLDEICDRLSTETIAVHADGAAFGFVKGLVLEGVRVYNKEAKRPLDPIFSCEEISIDPVQRVVRLVAPKVPRLHDGYYEPWAPPPADAPPPVFPVLKQLPPFTLEVERTQILGIEAELVEARVEVRPEGVWVKDIVLDWPDPGVRQRITGDCTIDFAAKRLYGSVRGLATQRQIRPMIEVLDIPVALPYIDGFTEVPKPVPAYCGWDVDLTGGGFNLDLDLSPTLGRYNGVSMRRADGKIGLKLRFPQAFVFDTTVGPVTAYDRDGRRLEGSLVVHGTNEDVTVTFDAESELKKNDLLSVMGFLNDGTLDCFVCETAPRVTARGALGARGAALGKNDLHGEIEVKKGSLFGVPFNDAKCDYSYVGNVVSFGRVAARGPEGGEIYGGAEIQVPIGTNSAPARFDVEIDYRGTLSEAASAFGMTNQQQRGKLKANVVLSGPLSTNVLAGLSGSGHMKVSEGQLNRINLFFGLTKILAEKVPGFTYIVDQSEGSGDFTITNGVLRTTNSRIEGGLFSIQMSGTYDLARDDLDVVVMVRLFKNESILAKLVHPITWAFTKMLMEFRLTGSVKDPKWEYVSVMDRMMGSNEEDEE